MCSCIRSVNLRTLPCQVLVQQQPHLSNASASAVQQDGLCRRICRERIVRLQDWPLPRQAEHVLEPNPAGMEGE